MGRSWQHGCPGAPHSMQLPLPLLLLQTRLLDLVATQKSELPRTPPGQQRSPSSPQARQMPESHTFSLLQLGAEVENVWQQGSFVPPHDTQTLEEPQINCLTAPALQLSRLSDPAQQDSPRSPHP